MLQVGGSVETLGQVWEQARPAQPVSQALRTGTGRAVLGLPDGGQLVLGSGSLMRVNNGQPDVQSGRFFASGKGQLYMSGAHLYIQGQVRFDASGKVLRVAVIEGQLRVSQSSRLTVLSSGQQYDFAANEVRPFSESDPWYRSQFVGEGEVNVQGTRGSVLTGLADQTPSAWKGAVIGQTLASGSRIKTGANAWAELGFTGGGYLRLQADSQLRVLGVEKTGSGRQVLLQLEAGSAWNVVQKGQGGYQITTPTVTTAVRGTVFRVDAAGLVKVFDGVVALPSQGDTPLAAQQQREASGRVEALKVDALDTFNLTLDAQRSSRTLLNISSLTQNPEFQLDVSSNPDATVTATIGDHTYDLTGEGGAYRLQQSLPEGRYSMTLRAVRPGQRQELTQLLVVDRTPPVLKISSVERVGVIVTIHGSVTDTFTAQPLLRATLAGKTYTLHASGSFDWTLPAASGPLDLQLTALDEAGNEGHAILP